MERFSFRPDEIADQHGRAKLAHAYATTIYGAQGLTTDRAFVLLSPDMDRHAVYVAARRAREKTEFFIDRRALDARIRADLPLSEKSRRPDIDDQARRAFLVGKLARSGLKQTTLDILQREEAPATPCPQRNRVADAVRRPRRKLSLD